MNTLPEVRSAILSAHDQLHELIGRVRAAGVRPHEQQYKRLTGAQSKLTVAMCELDELDQFLANLDPPRSKRA